MALTLREEITEVVERGFMVADMRGVHVVRTDEQTEIYTSMSPTPMVIHAFSDSDIVEMPEDWPDAVVAGIFLDLRALLSMIEFGP